MKHRRDSTGSRILLKKFDIKLPKGAQTTHGRQLAASKKRINIKTEPREPSKFEKILPAGVASEKNDQNSKKIKANGNCGFRVIAWALGHEFYLNEGFLYEIKRVAQRIVHLMAEVYNMPVFYYVKYWSQAFFLSTNLPNNNPIFIGLTESQNSVVLKIKDENLFPVAQLEKNWEQIATPEAMQCKSRYLSCFELTQRLKLETDFEKL
ncbi:hypothetical protein VP01_1153g4 [Puccinia sorghi]|uniref:Uncharacterized protein n=1 Tax=Puccinia sorghi TaxID=27349 RepID=A0A0L6VRY1_9BASI|nr:hypothetical protein VP01_1153g4 [Puccinia sorghi]